MPLQARPADSGLVVEGHATWTPTVCRIVAFSAIFGGFGLLFYIRLGSRQVFGYWDPHVFVASSAPISLSQGQHYLKGDFLAILRAPN